MFDLPDEPPVIAVAASGPVSAAIAAEYGDGLFATEPKPDLVEAYRRGGGDGPRYAEVPLAWASDEQQAVRAAWETSRWAVTGWKVMSELPNPVNFDAASRTVTDDDIRAQFAVGGPRRARGGGAEVRRRGFRPPRAAERRSRPGRLHRLLSRHPRRPPALPRLLNRTHVRRHVVGAQLTRPA
ncbi:LLM class flavin-dependent oxidoreductase [Micromonospora sp. WMMD708]|uniref:LLM class flavin-dependent oxidoreductase n=1 Tax=Micromonospora sp. WMMD708 TaxID=3403464 RepID=UPI003BF54A0B